MLDTQPYATLLLEGRKAKALQTERRTDGRTEGRTHAPVLSRYVATKNDTEGIKKVKRKT